MFQHLIDFYFYLHTHGAILGDIASALSIILALYGLFAFFRDFLPCRVRLSVGNFYILRRHFNVQNVTNVTSAIFYGGGNVPSEVRQEIIKLTTPKVYNVHEHIAENSTSTLCREHNASKHFVNLTNHPLEAWSEEQLAAASAYGEAVDYPFPAVAPAATEEDIAATASEIVADITAHYGTECTVHLMGEFTMTAALLQRFLQRGIVCVASTTERIVNETEPGKKVVEFKFVKFRKYN